MRAALAVIALLLAASPALAQFPPPGVYACVDADGHAVGTWTLLVAGDYDFVAADGTEGKGQVTSAGSDVEAISGPLGDMGWSGGFGTDETGATLFRFTDAGGKVVECR